MQNTMELWHSRLVQSKLMKRPVKITFGSRNTWHAQSIARSNLGTSYIGGFPTKLPYLMMMMTTMMKMTMTMTMMDDGHWWWLRGRPPQRWWGRERGRRQWWTVTFPPLRKNHFKSCENGPKLQSKRNSGWDTPALVVKYHLFCRKLC